MSRKKTLLSIVDDGFSVEGTIRFSGELLIRGHVGGKIHGDTVTIAEKGVASAEMNVRRLTIGGHFEGDVHAAEEIVILPTGSCNGRVHCLNLVVHEGGRLNAEVTRIHRQDTYRQKKLSPTVRPVIEL